MNDPLTSALQLISDLQTDRQNLLNRLDTAQMEIDDLQQELEAKRIEISMLDKELIHGMDLNDNEDFFFHVGDEVECYGDPNCVGTIIQIDHSQMRPYQVNFPRPWEMWYSASELKLRMAFAFQVGDHVRLQSATNDAGIGIIKQVKSNNITYPYEVDFPNRPQPMYFTAAELILVAPATIFNVGDWVEVIAPEAVSALGKKGQVQAIKDGILVVKVENGFTYSLGLTDVVRTSAPGETCFKPGDMVKVVNSTSTGPHFSGKVGKVKSCSPQLTYPYEVYEVVIECDYGTIGGVFSANELTLIPNERAKP